ncbi:MAG: ankyrin repeat domain-containing protein, partial [Sedimentisphaerales bacterium]|nr:ankyrin repeat domain-containing protein [Sedimentisphaerales bacterium]
METKRLLLFLIAAMIFVTGCTKKPTTGAKTSLHRAAEKGDIEQVKLLIANGSNVNARNSDNRTPLYKANVEVAEFLIAHEADVNANDDHGDTPLHETVS